MWSLIILFLLTMWAMAFLIWAVVEMAAAKRQGAPPSSRSRCQAMSISEAYLSDVKLPEKARIP